VFLCAAAWLAVLPDRLQRPGGSASRAGGTSARRVGMIRDAEDSSCIVPIRVGWLPKFDSCATRALPATPANGGIGSNGSREKLRLAGRSLQAREQARVLSYSLQRWHEV